MEDIWFFLKSIILKTREPMIDTNRQAKKPWMTQNIMELMEQRRLAKTHNVDLYKSLHRTIKNEIRHAKEEWMNGRCQEIEDLSKRHDTFNVHKKIKEATGRYRKRTTGNIKDQSGNLVYEIEEKLKVWQNYIINLFNDDTRPERTTPINAEGPDITISEVRYAIKMAKNDKAVGPDNIPVEILKVMEDDCLRTLTQFFNKIHTTGIIPDEWLMSTFVTLPKKSNAQSCEDFRTISLMSHVLKVFLKIIHARIYKKCESNVTDTQFGFRNGLGTREALFAIQVLFQRCRDVNCDVYACFVDYTKAFDKCQHGKMMESLRRTGIDTKDMRIISNLYWGQKAVVRVEEKCSEPVEIRRGVRQGCVLSPLLFNLYSEDIFRESLDGIQGGIKINGENINNIRYADDAVLIASSLENLQELVNSLNVTSKEYGLELNIKKTKYMVISKTPTPYTELLINNDVVERVEKFSYLGTTLCETWDHSVEIKCRIEKARSTFITMKNLLTSGDLSLELKNRIVKCYIYPVLLYGVESWTLSEAAEKRIEAFEMWVYRRILKIPWTDHVSNNEVLNRMKCQPQLLLTIKTRKLEYFGHVMRNDNKYRLLQNIIQEKVEGKRGPGRRRISWLANLRRWYGVTSTELFRCAANRIRIAMMIANIRNG